MIHAYIEKTRNRADINFFNFDLDGILKRVREGKATDVDKMTLASFCGAFLRYWQDEKELINKGIIQKHNL